MAARFPPAMRWVLVWLVALTALAGFHFAVVVKAQRALERRHDQVTVKVDRYNVLRNAGTPREREELKRQQGDLIRQYTDLVFDSNRLGDLDFEIRRIADEKGLLDFSSRRTGTTSAIGASKLTRIAQRELVLSCAGSFPNILQFINALERHYPVVFVDQCTLKAATAKDESGLSCTMECSVLYETATK